jgi:hypothetical protein
LPLGFDDGGVWPAAGGSAAAVVEAKRQESR